MGIFTMKEATYYLLLFKNNYNSRRAYKTGDAKLISNNLLKISLQKILKGKPF